jgi:hypothetical protein
LLTNRSCRSEELLSRGKYDNLDIYFSELNENTSPGYGAEKVDQMSLLNIAQTAARAIFCQNKCITFTVEKAAPKFGPFQKEHWPE